MMNVKPIWPTVKLGSLASFRNGLNYSKANFGNGLKVINVRDFGDRSTPAYDSLEEINPNGIFREESLLQKNDILFVRSNGNRELIGRSMMLKENLPFPVSHSAFTIRARFESTQALPEFFSYVFKTPLIRSVLSTQGNGANISNLNQDILNRLEVPLPSLKIQQRISYILSAYDDLIENNTRRIAILEEMARRIYEEWFVRFRFPGYEQVKMVESELGLIPEGWQLLRMGDYCYVTDYVANGSFAALKENVTYCDKPNYAVLVRTKDYGAAWGGSFVYVTEESYRFLKKSTLSTGDIVIGNVGNAGMTFRVPDLGQPMTLGPNAITVRPESNKSYVYEYLCSNTGQHLIKGITSGAAQPKFNKTEFRKLFLPLPPEELLARYKKVADPLWQLKEHLRKKTTNLRATRDLLLPKLISGELDVSTLPEPEEVITE